MATVHASGRCCQSVLRPSRLFILGSTLTRYIRDLAVAGVRTCCVCVCQLCLPARPHPMYHCTLVNGGSNSGRSRQPPAPVFCPWVGWQAGRHGGHSRKKMRPWTCPYRPDACLAKGRAAAALQIRTLGDSHLEPFDSLLPCSCPDTQPSAASDFVTCRFHFSSVHHRKLFSREPPMDPRSVSRTLAMWSLRTTRHIHAHLLLGT